MAPRLPDPTQLGQVRSGGNRPIAQMDLAPLARGAESFGRAVGEGGQAMARAVNEGGQAYARAVGQGGQAIGGAMAKAGQLEAEGARAFGKGLSDAGSGIIDFQIDRNRWDYAKATSDFLSSTTDLKSSFSRDNDYTTLESRFTDAAEKQRQKSASLIEDPGMRERFLTATAPQLAQDVATMRGRAEKLEGDASIAYVDQQGSKSIDQGAGTGDTELQSKLVRAQSQLIDGLVEKGTITPLQALKMKQDWAHQYAIADGLVRSKSDPTGVINDLRAAPGSDEAIVNRIETVEGTGANPLSSARGTGQFTDATWLSMIKSKRPDLAQGQSDQDILAMRADRNLARDMIRASVDDNRNFLKSKGVEPTAGNLYLAHFLGPKAAAAVASADPKEPVAKVLVDAVGPEWAAKMIAANPKQLMGQQAGSVAGWAESQMGGASAGGVHIYDVLRPDQRAVLLNRAENELRRQETVDQSALKQRVDDTLTEASRTGFAVKPVSQEEFIAGRGLTDGPQLYKTYQDQLRFYADRNSVAALGPDEQAQLLAQYRPKEGEPGYEMAAKRYDELGKAIAAVNTEREKDPAAFVVAHMPASADAFRTFGQALGNPLSTPAQKQAAARDYATKVTLDQTRLGITPDRVTIVPKPYIEALKAKVENPQGEGGSAAVVKQVQSEAQLWGDAWPKVYRQIGGEAGPLVRVIGSGIPEQPARILAEVGPQSLSDILKDQSTERSAQVKKDVLEQFKPLIGSMAGNEGSVAVFNDFRGQGEKLAAYYVMQGMTSSDAAKKSFNDLIGDRYDFRDTWRMPKGLAQSADLVQAGTVQAKRELDSIGVLAPRDTIGGLSADYLLSSKLSAIKRDGKWVTAPDESGLALIYNDEAVRRADGRPLIMTWAELGTLGQKANEARDRQFDRYFRLGTFN